MTFKFKPGATYSYIQRTDGSFFTGESPVTGPSAWTTDKSKAFRFIGTRDAKTVCRSMVKYSKINCSVVLA